MARRPTLAEAAGGLALTLRDEDGIATVTHAQLSLQPAHNADQADAALRTSLTKLGNTMFEADGIALELSQPWFVPAAAINALRPDAVAAHEAARLAAWERPERKAPAEPPAVDPATQLSYLANVCNEKRRAFYRKHGVGLIDAAYEAHQEAGEVSLMITKHCMSFSFNLCPKQAKCVQAVQGQVRTEPMTLRSGEETYTLRFV